MPEDEHVLAEISVEPVVAGEEHRGAIQQAIAALRGSDVSVTVGAMSTLVEGTLDAVLAHLALAHRIAATHSERTISTVRIESKQGGLHRTNREVDVAQTTSRLPS